MSKESEPLLIPGTPAHDRSAPPIELEHVSVHYNGVRVLEDLTFSIPAGQRLAVVGPNGAGKTTLFNVIAGTLHPSHGSASVFGHGPGSHVCIAYVPQRNQIDWTFPVTVSEVVMMGRVRKIGLFNWPRREDWRAVSQALERVGITDLHAQQIGELSGGQQQRVFLARALAQDSDVILMDEPLTALDIPSQEAIFRILDELRTEGVTVIVATHDLNLAADRFDQVMLLNRRLVAIGTPEEVFTHARLMEAYGSHVHAINGEEGVMILTDTCCEGGEGE